MRNPKVRMNECLFFNILIYKGLFIFYLVFVDLGGEIHPFLLVLQVRQVESLSDKSPRRGRCYDPLHCSGSRPFAAYT